MTADFEEVARGFGREPHLRRVVLPLKAVHERESLMSIVYRTAERTELTPGHIILSAGYPHRQTYNMAVTELQRAPDLAYVLGVAEDEVRARIYAETFHSGRGCTFVNFAGASVPATLLNVRERKIAPAALEDRPFHHLLSEHRLLPFDADTGTLLISRCPECRKRLAWTVVRSFYRCPCGADLRTAPSIAVPEEFVDGATAMAHLLDPRTATHAPAVEALPASIRTMNRGSLFEIGWQTAVAIGFAERPEANAANWPDDCKIRTLDLAARLLANWPASAEAAFAEIASTEHRRRAVTSLAALARSTRIPDDVRAGIRSILPPRATATRAASSGRPHGVNLTASERSLRREAYAARGGEVTIVGWPRTSPIGPIM